MQFDESLDNSMNIFVLQFSSQVILMDTHQAYSPTFVSQACKRRCVALSSSRPFIDRSCHPHEFNCLAPVSTAAVSAVALSYCARIDAPHGVFMLEPRRSA